MAYFTTRDPLSTPMELRPVTEYPLRSPRRNPHIILPDGLPRGVLPRDEVPFSYSRGQADRVGITDTHEPDRTELFLLDIGEKKVEWKEDSRKWSFF
jgi:hypothetical protein